MRVLSLIIDYLSSYGGLMAKPGESSAGVIHITWLGLGMISVYSTISGMAGVYTEYILKGKYEVVTLLYSISLENAFLFKILTWNIAFKMLKIFFLGGGVTLDIKVTLNAGKYESSFYSLHIIKVSYVF